MDQRGPKSFPGLSASGGASRQKYKCNVCSVEPRGCDIPKHYETNVNWIRLKEMKKCIGDAALDEMKRQTDPHTLFVYQKNYSKLNLPTFRTHVMVKPKAPMEQRRD
jgi:hypothetical protein